MYALFYNNMATFKMAVLRNKQVNCHMLETNESSFRNDSNFDSLRFSGVRNGSEYRVELIFL